MLSGGDGHFVHLLPALGQTSSYFSFANADWMVIALGTAYVDAAIDAEQLRWLEQTIELSGGRKIMLRSHHYLFSRFQGTAWAAKLRAALQPLLARETITAWYWSHEMRCVVYDPAPLGNGLKARCVGYSGFPARRIAAIRNAPAARTAHGVEWKRFAGASDVPACLVLDGPNPYVPGREEKYGPHGYMTLEFSGQRCTERVHLADGSLVLEQEL
jgi:hypothetical protein